MTPSKKTLLHLALIDGVGPATVVHLIKLHKEKKINLPDIYSKSSADLHHLCGITQKRAQKIVTGLADQNVLETELFFLEKNEITCTTLLDENYPEDLKHIYTPPPVLFCKGAALTQQAKRLAIVGSRKATKYSSDFLRSCIPAFVECGLQIVSGGARGADTMAHMHAVNANGITLAIFGCGLGTLYPPENRELFENILESGGTLISSFSYATKPDRWLFPARNRMIAGLSQGCLVVQAAKKSGALITAEFALQQGRNVFAVPGPIDHELSAGCNYLIQQGAKLVMNAGDVLEEFGILRDDHRRNNEANDENSIMLCSPENVSKHPILSSLTTPKSLDELIIATNLSRVELQTQLFQLQCEGKVRQNFAGLWECV